MTLEFRPLEEATAETAAAFSRWDNDPATVHLIRHCKNAEELARQVPVSQEVLTQRLENHRIFLMYLDGLAVGEMNYMVDPEHLARRVPGTAWIGIGIGEASARGRGIGGKALAYLEDRIRDAGLSRIELGVFEYNHAAEGLYRKLGYKEFTRIPEFNYWQGRMWDDIRMEKLL